jgi:hypothetical protein
VISSDALAVFAGDAGVIAGAFSRLTRMLRVRTVAGAESGAGVNASTSADSVISFSLRTFSDWPKADPAEAINGSTNRIVFVFTLHLVNTF